MSRGSSPEPKPQESAAHPSVYYAGSEGLRLHSQPTRASPPIAVLPLHQKLYRSKVEHGFAYVKVDGSGEQGWVENDQLIWRLPREGKEPAPQPKAPEVETGSHQPDAAPLAADAATQEKLSNGAPAREEIDAKVPESVDAEASEEVDPSLFDPL